MAANIRQIKMNMIKERIDHRSETVFQTEPAQSRLESIQLSSNCNDIQSVNDLSQLESLKTLFIVRQRLTWSRINITRPLFERFIEIFNIFPDIWKSVFALGLKVRENEVAFPGPCSRNTIKGVQNKSEISYILRRVEYHGRECGPTESPWSIRQTAVYHQISADKDMRHPKSMFLLISPSFSFEDELSSMIQSDTDEVDPWMVHWLLVADSAKGWTEYLSWIEDQLQDRAGPIHLATVGDEYNAKSLANYKFSFEDRQDLSRFEEYISVLQIILPTMLENITRLRDVYQEWAFEHSPFWDHLGLLAEFDEHITDVKKNIQRVEVLKDRLQSNIRLLTDLLSYEEACALKSLAQESQAEGKVASLLAFQNTKDATAVKVLTVISLIYLPTSIVANFFSTEFVKAENGKMVISAESWMLAAAALPLTAITFGLWWLCVWFASPVYQRHGSASTRNLRGRVWDIIVGKDFADPEDGEKPQKEREYQIPPRRQTTERWMASKAEAKMD